MRASRDTITDLVSAVVRGIPNFEGRVFREGVAGWDERTFPTAVVSTEGTRVVRLGQQDGYELERRTSVITVAIGVREFVNEDPLDELSDLVAAVEDAVVDLEFATVTTAPRLVETVDVSEIGEILVEKDTHGKFMTTDISFVIEFCTQKGRAEQILAG